MNMQFFASSLSHFLPSVEPKVYVSPGPSSLLDGHGETLVATCTAERGRPAAKVFWESDLLGRTVNSTHLEPEGTTTTLVQYFWAPTRDAFGRSLSCIVRHPALSKDFRIPYRLNVSCECELLLSTPSLFCISMSFLYVARSADRSQFTRCQFRSNVNVLILSVLLFDILNCLAAVCLNGTLLNGGTLWNIDLSTARAATGAEIQVGEFILTEGGFSA